MGQVARNEPLALAVSLFLSFSVLRRVALYLRNSFTMTIFDGKIIAQRDLFEFQIDYASSRFFSMLFARN